MVKRLIMSIILSFYSVHINRRLVLLLPTTQIKSWGTTQATFTNLPAKSGEMNLKIKWKSQKRKNIHTQLNTEVNDISGQV